MVRSEWIATLARHSIHSGRVRWFFSSVLSLSRGPRRPQTIALPACPGRTRGERSVHTYDHFSKELGGRIYVAKRASLFGTYPICLGLDVSLHGDVRSWVKVRNGSQRVLCSSHGGSVHSYRGGRAPIQLCLDTILRLRCKCRCKKVRIQLLGWEVFGRHRIAQHKRFGW